MGKVDDLNKRIRSEEIQIAQVRVEEDTTKQEYQALKQQLELFMQRKPLELVKTTLLNEKNTVIHDIAVLDKQICILNKEIDDLKEIIETEGGWAQTNQHQHQLILDNQITTLAGQVCNNFTNHLILGD